MTYGQFLDHNSAIVAHMKLKTRMGSKRLARQSFGMLKFRKDCSILLSYVCESRKTKEKERKRRKKRKDYQIRNFQVMFFQPVKG